MDLRFSVEDEAFRSEIRTFLDEGLTGEFAEVRGRGGPGDERSCFDERVAWERHLASNGWTCVGWPKEHGGRGLSLHQQVIYFEEYARAKGPGRVGHIGETLLGPTLIAFGSPEQRQRFLPPIVAGDELWCQGYSEPDAGSDLANLSTKAELDPHTGEWVIDGQKTWTSLAEWADWCFVLARTDRSAPRHRGISYLLVPMDQPGIDIRPIHQATGDSEFSEVFFSGARTAGELVVGEPNDGWRVAMGTLAFERGVSTLGQNLMFQSEWHDIVERGRANGLLSEPLARQRAASLWSRLQLMRLNALRILSAGPETLPAAMVTKLFWSHLHRDLGELGIDLLGMDGTLQSASTAAAQRRFMFSRADTIYAGSSEIQRNLIGERALGLPKEPS